MYMNITFMYAPCSKIKLTVLVSHSLIDLSILFSYFRIFMKRQVLSSSLYVFNYRIVL